MVYCTGTLDREGVYMRSESLVRQYVNDGFTWLTGFYGDTSWVWRISLTRLNMQKHDLCVAGQLEGEWEDALGKYGLTLAESMKLGLWTDGSECYYEDLTNKWERVITDERNRLRQAVVKVNEEKFPINVTVEVMLTAEQIGRVYLDAKERGITVEEYVANEVGYAADRIQY